MGRIPVLGAALLLAMADIAHGQSQGQPKPDQSQGQAKPAQVQAKPAQGQAKPPAATAAAPKEEPKPPPPAPRVVKPKEQADSLLGKEVFGTDGRQMGLVTNVLIDGDGHPVALVIDFGGFLGLGSRKIAVDWHLMEFHPGNKEKPVMVRLTQDQLKLAPEYKPDKPAAEVIFAPAPAPLPTKPAANAAPSASAHTQTSDHNGTK